MSSYEVLKITWQVSEYVISTSFLPIDHFSNSDQLHLLWDVDILFTTLVVSALSPLDSDSECKPKEIVFSVPGGVMHTSLLKIIIVMENL